jgi:hypothetical protein
MNAARTARRTKNAKNPTVRTFSTDFKAAAAQIMASVSVTAAELETILVNAQAANDTRTIAAVARAQQGDATAQLVCAMILGR